MFLILSDNGLEVFLVMRQHFIHYVHSVSLNSHV